MIDDIVKMSPLAKYCVPGEQRSMDAVFYKEFLGDGADVTSDDDVYYSTYGHHLDAVSTIEPLGKTITGKRPFDCMKACESVEGCMAFR